MSHLQEPEVQKTIQKVVELLQPFTKDYDREIWEAIIPDIVDRLQVDWNSPVLTFVCRARLIDALIDHLYRARLIGSSARADTVRQEASEEIKHLADGIIDFIDSLLGGPSGRHPDRYPDEAPKVVT